MSDVEHNNIAYSLFLMRWSL